MNILASLPLALGLLVASAPSPSAASDPASTGVLPVPANHLVGMWKTDIYVSPQACTPGAPPPPLIGHNTMVFNAGGTAVENPQVTPAGVPGEPQLRTFGLGKWSYDVRTRQYKLLLRFDSYASSDGLFLGHMEVDRTMVLSNNRNTASGPVVATRYAPDGSVVLRLCGRGVSHRL
ncbi:MAG TPA: hypothetical protein PK743_03855 [Luteimonas sp.]|nr:hypothetical protein [Luteimonas sp.]HRO26205.1 hypothetical protein [Luteimonas sp.]HRP71757.1 hypothetical protein [Luteimonas sp.]